MRAIIISVCFSLLLGVSAFLVDIAWVRQTTSPEIIFAGIEANQDPQETSSKSLIIHDKSTVYALNIATGHIEWSLDFSNSTVKAVVKRGELFGIFSGFNVLSRPFR
jgi:outer membrane protein assembly factor BamB